jgi:hypothetical protein
MNKNYAIVVKTGDAEFRALENLSPELKSKVLPIVEITRGRKIIERSPEEKKANKESGKELYPFEKRITRLKEVLKEQQIALDLTSDSNLSNKEIDRLFLPNNGYENWVSFLVELKNESVFSKIIPCILLNVEDPDFYENLKGQVRGLKEHFPTLIYRNNIVDENCYDDLTELRDALNGVELYIMVDSGYVLPAAHRNYSEKIKARITNLRKQLPAETNFIVSSTSFPNSISDIGDDYSDTFRLVELDIFNDVYSDNPLNLIYSDYATVNPVRNDAVPMARGWIPRIDVALPNEVYYYRKRRPKGIKQYVNTYVAVAALVMSDKRFPTYLGDNWGVEEIRNCAKNKPSNTSPGFWISVRMNMHIHQQILRIYG